MKNNNSKNIVGVYDNEQEAIAAIEALKSRGYRAEDISVIGKNKDDVDNVTEETGSKAGEGAAAGATAGGALGGLAGLLAGVGALAIPGIGPIVAAGPIAATLTGAAAGAGVGGLAGALIGMGIPEEDAKHYEESVKAGKILVLVDEDTGLSNTTSTGAIDERRVDNSRTTGGFEENRVNTTGGIGGANQYGTGLGTTDENLTRRRGDF